MCNPRNSVHTDIQLSLTTTWSWFCTHVKWNHRSMQLHISPSILMKLSSVTLLKAQVNRYSVFRAWLIFLVAQQPHLGLGHLTDEVSGSHRHTTLGRLPWISDLAAAETSIWQHMMFNKDRRTCLWRNSNTQSQQASGWGPTRGLITDFLFVKWNWNRQQVTVKVDTVLTCRAGLRLSWPIWRNQALGSWGICSL